MYDHLVERMQAQNSKSIRVDHMIFHYTPTEIYVTNPDNVKHILKDNFDNYIKTQPNGDEYFFGFRQFLGEGVFTLSHGPHDALDQGKSWYLHRKNISHMFTQSKFKSFILDTFADKGNVLVEQLTKELEGGAVDLQSYFFKYTMDSFGKIAFNAEWSTIQGESNEYGEAFDGAHVSFMEFLQKNALAAGLLEVLPMQNPVRRVVEWVMGCTVPSLKRFHQCKATLKRYTLEVCSDKKSKSPKESSDILGLFLDHPERTFTDDQLVDIVLNLIIAGRDTTACLLTWTFYELGMNPEVLVELTRQLDGADPDDFYSMRDQHYLTAVLYEAARLHPAVPIDTKMAATDDVLPDGTKIRAGVQVGYAAYLAGRDPELWPEPLVFRPERWLVDGTFKNPSLYEYPVFQAGPRVCLGMNFALMEASVATTKLVQAFEIEPGWDNRLQPCIPETGKLTMGIKGPLLMKLRTRG
eukprot:TRINITY_DN11405_c0_g1_i3.p1 TRINITY_DN11405_c0_g1~~TRINITY_DN11405_c0_g1_i3.p1  ORF type:complete len:467 (+),score=101.49 TRINITY_DN11405_c0_g1_i3:232-1632(+)